MKKVGYSSSYEVSKKNRKVWHINPVERVKESKKHYDRNEIKRELNNIMRDLE